MAGFAGACCVQTGWADTRLHRLTQTGLEWIAIIKQKWAYWRAWVIVPHLNILQCISSVPKDILSISDVYFTALGQSN